MSVPATVALAVLLLGAACTGAEPKPEPQLRAQKPVKRIDTEFLVESHKAQIREYEAMPCCGIYHPPPPPVPKVYPRRTNALVARLQEQQPTWLRYITAVEVFSFSENTVVNSSKGGDGPNRLVGVRINGPGKEVGRTICDSLLIQRGISAVTVWGAEEGPGAPVLASCQSLDS